MSPTKGSKKVRSRASARSSKGRIGPDDDDRVASLFEEMRRDRKLAPCVAEYERTAGGRLFGANALKVGGKLFALSTQGTLVVKLPSERVDALIAEGSGEKLTMGKGRAMNQWLALLGEDRTWLERVREAFDFVSRLESKGRAAR